MEALEKDLCADVHPRTLKRRLALGIGFLVLLCALLVSASSGVVEIAPHDLLRRTIAFSGIFGCRASSRVH